MNDTKVPLGHHTAPSNTIQETVDVSASTATLQPPSSLQVPDIVSGDGQSTDGLPVVAEGVSATGRQSNRPSMYNNRRSSRQRRLSYFSGIDSIGLLLRDFTVAENASLTIENKADATTGETNEGVLYETTAGIVYGGKAYMNHSLFNATLHGPSAIAVKCSLPKLLDSDNRTEAKGHRIQLALKKLESLLRQEGISTFLLEASVYRLDLCRTVTLDRDVNAYTGAVRSLSYPRMDARHYYSGALWRNSRHQISLYDKEKEQIGKDGKECRVEYRLVKGSAVKDKAGIHAAEDLTSQHHLKRLDELYTTVTSKLLDVNTEEIDAATDTTGQKALLQALLNDGVHAAQNVMQQVMWLASASQEEREATQRAVLKLKGNQAAWRQRKKWDKLQPYADLYNEEKTSRTVLYRELKEAFTIA